MRLKPILIAAVLVAAALAVTYVGFEALAPQGGGPPPAVAPVPPLPAPQSVSTIVAPVTVSIEAIRDLAERNAPRIVNGRADNPAPQLIQDADIAWTVSRGPIAAVGAQDTLSLTTPLNGTINASGKLSGDVQGALGNALGGLLGGNVAKQIGSINVKRMNATAEIKGTVAIAARPQLLANWRLDPNLVAQVNLADSNIAIAGARLNVPAQVKPVIDRNVADQISIVQQRIRNDPALENNARQQWTKLCRSIPLQSAAATVKGAPALPDLWLEMKPVRGIAAQPRIDAAAMTLMLGLDAETRITTSQTKPECPFPATLTIVPPGPGRLNIGVPIDLPFSELDRIVTSQLVGKTFPEDGSGAFAVTVNRATVVPSGDRLLISLLLAGQGKKGWFGGVSGDATVHIWGKPDLDRAQQILRLADITVAVESEAAFGLLGTASRAAMPYLQRALAERAVIDLKPFAQNAQQRIAAAIAELQKNDSGVRIQANVTTVKLGAVAFDAKTLRVTAEAEGAVSGAITTIRIP